MLIMCASLPAGCRGSGGTSENQTFSTPRPPFLPFHTAVKIPSFRRIVPQLSEEEGEEAAKACSHGNCREENSCSERAFIFVIASSFLQS